MAGKPDFIFQSREVVGQPKLPFTQPSECGSDCSFIWDGTIIHRPSCLACRRIYCTKDGLTRKEIWLDEYVQQPCQAYIPQWATAGQIKKAEAGENAGKKP